MRTNAILGSFAGLLLGIAGVLIRERADRTLQQPGDAQLWTNVPELGVIPSAKLDAARKSYSDVPAERETRLPSKANSFGVELVTLHHKASVISESFRNVLTSILFMGENGARPRVLVLTSGASGDGKTVSVSNLAICAAEIRQKVLVIDADLRRPRVHDVFQVPNEQGLSTILRDDSIDIDRAASLVQPTSIHNLDVLTSGPATAAAAHLLYSPALTALIDKFRVLYDMILIDTPPSLDLTDARLIGRMADAVVIVTRAGRTTKEVATTLSRRFAEDHTRVIGTILNDWNPADSSKGYYGYYSAYYHKKETAPAQNG